MVFKHKQNQRYKKYVIGTKILIMRTSPQFLNSNSHTASYKGKKQQQQLRII